MNTWRGVIVIVAILSIFFLLTRDSDYRAQFNRIDRDFISLEDRMRLAAGNWIHYLETRVNRLSQSQDEYQVSTSKRIDLLEERIRHLEKRIKQQEEVIASQNKRMIQRDEIP